MKALVASAVLVAAPFAALAAEPAPAKPAPAKAAAADPASLAETPEAAPSPLMEALAAYAAFQKDISTLRTHELKGVKDVDTALTTVVRHDPEQLAYGWYAYLAMAAAQEPTFVKEVKEIEATYGRASLVQGLQNDPRYALQLKGADEALKLALHAARSDSKRVANVNARFQDLKYNVQKTTWAKAVLGKGKAVREKTVRKAAADGAAFTMTEAFAKRLQPAAASVNPLSDPAALGGSLFWDVADSGAETATLTSFSPPEALSRPDGREVEAGQVLALAAYYAIGAHADEPDGVNKILAWQNPGRSNTFNAARDCLSDGRNQFFSALTAAHSQAESVASIADHLDSYEACLNRFVVSGPVT